MDKSKLVECFRLLTIDNSNGCYRVENLESRVEEVYKILEIDYGHTITCLPHVTSLNFSKTIAPDWKYICLGFYITKTLSDLSDKSDQVFLSVQETKDFKKFLKSIVHVGICTKLQPNLPFCSKPKLDETEDIFFNYNILKCTTFGLAEFLKIPVLRFCIIPEGLKEILVALYQISYCPLKKPEAKSSDNIMSKEIYAKLVEEQQFFVTVLEHLKQTIHPNIFVKDTMAILHNNSPPWFRKQVSQALTNILRSKNGVEFVAVAMFSDFENDSAQIWKILDVFSKLILSLKKFSDFEDNVCKQLVALLHKQQNEERSFAENIFTHCTKLFYKEDQEICKSVFIREIVSNFLYFTYRTHKFCDYDDVTDKIKLTSRMLHALFIENTPEENVIPISIIQPIINVIFRFYTLSLDSSFKSLNNDLKDILLLYLENQQNVINIFDTLLFNINSRKILSFRNDLTIEINTENIKIKNSRHLVNYSSAENCEFMLNLIKSKPKLLIKLFGYLLNCITNENKYFQRTQEDLLQLEDEFTTEYFERKIVVYKLLSEIADEKVVQNQLKENCTDIVEYIYKMLNKTLQLKAHLLEEADNEGLHSLFTILMIVENLLQNSASKKDFQILLETLHKIHSETKNKELKTLVESNLNLIQGTNSNKTTATVDETKKSELDKVVYDICDSLLPTRGHGLLSLTKLIQKKNKDVLKRKQFVLNILQQNLTNKDSFIYLNAINGLAAMADIFPDTILKILCEEYSDSSRKETEDASEVRMKLGEVLVKVSKVLGEMAPKHKPLLLNTFLIGTKDHDDLIRASSLSNLGEICRVLGYKLGTMFTEVLVCVHAIISTDKSPQARRAAVTVLRQLFIGLDQEIIAFFKDDILPVYRTLKQIYNNDTDDVMRLQAQLALEELNESMKNFVFPKPKLNFDGKVVMMD